MKTKTRSIIAIALVLVAVLSIAFILTISFVRIRPMSGLAGSDSYQIYHNGKMVNGGTATSDKIVSHNSSGIAKYESTSVDEIFDKCGYSLFKSWFQFYYDLGYSFEDNDEFDHAYIDRDGMKQIANGSSEKLGGVFSISLHYAEAQSITMTDSRGNSIAQEFNTAVVKLTDTSDSVGRITMYVYDSGKVLGSPDLGGIALDAVGYHRFYPIQISAVTTGAIEVLTDIFGV